jgi:streptomycin 6-kinase
VAFSSSTSGPLPPVELRRTIVEWFGDEGRHWCDALPDTVARLTALWKLSPGKPLAGATHALVLDCLRADGSPVVLKLPFVDNENRTEADALRLYDGDGAVRLLDDDPTSGALLLERLVPGTPLLNLSDRNRAVDIACSILCRLRRPVPGGHRFPLLRDLAASWARHLPAKQNRLAHPLPRQLVEEAAQLASDLAAWNGDDVVVNRDPHLANFLSARREPWLLIDPKPVVGEAAFDGSYLLVANLEEDATRAVASSAAERIAAGLGVESGRVRTWAFVRAIDSALWARGLGDVAKMSILIAKARLLDVA